MTKKEALNRLRGLRANSKDHKNVDVAEVAFLIKDIFRDVKSKICKNCLYYDRYNKDNGLCTHDWHQEYGFVKGEVMRVNKDFGCNQFEWRI